MKGLLFLPLLGFFLPETHGLINKVPVLVSEFYDIVLDRFNFLGNIDEESLVEFFERYDNYFMNVEEIHFSSGSESWVRDFNTPPRETAAYFRLNDVYPEIFRGERYRRIARNDISIMFFRLDTNEDYFLSEQEFKDGFFELYRALPYGAWFVEKDVAMKDYYTELEFYGLIEAADTNGDGEISVDELRDYWTGEGYGDAATGTDLHARLDVNADGVLTRIDDLGPAYTYCNSWDPTDPNIEFEEYIRLDRYRR